MSCLDLINLIYFFACLLNIYINKAEICLWNSGGARNRRPTFMSDSDSEEDEFIPPYVPVDIEMTANTHLKD